MQVGQQDSGGRTRLLLLAAAAGAAGFGLSLAVADDAHAVDRTPGFAEHASSVVKRTGDLAVGAVKVGTPDRSHRDAPPRRSGRLTGTVKRPASESATSARRVVGEATGNARSAARHVRKTTGRPPLSTEAVTEARDLAGSLIDKAVAAIPTLPTPPMVDVVVPSISDRPAVNAPASPVSPQTAPGPAEGEAPTPPPAGSGAPTATPKPAAQYSTAEAITPTSTLTVAVGAPSEWHASTPQPTTPPYPAHTAGGEHSVVSAASGHAPGITITHGWTVPTEWQLAVTRYIGHHHGRIHSPLPPSG